MPRKRTVSLSPKKARCRRPPPAARVCCKDCPTLASPFPSHSSTPSFTPHDTVHTSKTLPLRHTASPAVCPTREQPFRTTQSRNPNCTTIHAFSPSSLVRALDYSIFTNKTGKPATKGPVRCFSSLTCNLHSHAPTLHACMHACNARTRRQRRDNKQPHVHIFVSPRIARRAFLTFEAIDSPQRTKVSFGFVCKGCDNQKSEFR